MKRAHIFLGSRKPRTREEMRVKLKTTNHPIYGSFDYWLSFMTKKLEEEFLFESVRQHGEQNLKDSKTNNQYGSFYEFVDRNLVWYKTARGDDYWSTISEL